MRQFKVSALWPHNRLVKRKGPMGLSGYYANPLSAPDKRNQFFFERIAPDFDSDAENGSKSKFTSQYDAKPTARQYVMTMYGTFSDGKTVAVNITGYRPYFHVRVPKGLNPSTFHADLIRYLYVSKMIKAKHNVPPFSPTDKRMTSELKRFIPGNGFCNNQLYDFVELRFVNSNTKMHYLRAVKRIVLNRTGNDYTFEYDFDDYKKSGNLQIYTEVDNENYRFFIDANVQSSGGEWRRTIRSCGVHRISLDKLYDAEPHTIQDHEYWIDYFDFRKLNETPPSEESFVQKHIVFDFETVPAVSLIKEQRKSYMIKHGAEIQKEWEALPAEERRKCPYEVFLKHRIEAMTKGVLPTDFRPKPNLREGDTIYSAALSIALVPDNDWTKAKWKNVVICIHGAKDATKKYNTTVTSDEDKFVFIETGTEAKLICAFLELIRRENPEYIHGYNSYKYDWEWLHERAKDLNYIQGGNSLRMSGKDLVNMFDHFNKEHNRFNVWKIDTKVTTALGKTTYHLPLTTGINNIDVCKYYFDLNDSKHKSHKLFDIAHHYLPESKCKKEFSFTTMNETYFKISKGLLTGDEAQSAVFDVAYYNIYDCISVQWLLATCNIIRSFEAGAELVLHSIQEFFLRRNTTKVVAGLSEIAMQDNKVLIRTGKEEGSIEDHVEELLEQMPHRKEEYMELKRAAEIDPKKKKRLATYREKIMDEHIVIGGKVQCHVPGFHQQVCTLDVKSMYPSNILAFNVCGSTIVEDMEFMDLPGVRYIYINWRYKDCEETGRENTTIFVCDFEGGDPKYTGILPKFIKKLLSDRARINKEMGAYVKSELAKGVPEAVIKKSGRYQSLNSQQLEVKKLTNSCYGVTLAVTFPFYNPQVGGCIPSKGREYIEMVTAIVEMVYGGKVVYGDTDSVFNKFANIFNPNADYLTNSYAAWDYNAKVVDFINNLCMKRGARSVVLELEKIFARIYISGKKRYCGEMYINRNPMKLEQKIAGYGVKKRDVSPFEEKAGKNIVNIVSSDRANQLGKYIDDLIRAVHLSGKYCAADFRRTLKWNGEDGYKDWKKMSQARLIAIIHHHDPGATILPGDRIEYVYLRYVDGIDQRDQFTKNMTIRNVRGYKTADKMWPLQLFDEATMEIDVYENFKRLVSAFADAFDEIVQRDGITLKPNKELGVVVPGDPINKGIRLGWLLMKFYKFEEELNSESFVYDENCDYLEKYKKLV